MECISSRHENSTLTPLDDQIRQAAWADHLIDIDGALGKPSWKGLSKVTLREDWKRRSYSTYEVEMQPVQPKHEHDLQDGICRRA